MGGVEGRGGGGDGRGMGGSDTDDPTGAVRVRQPLCPLRLCHAAFREEPAPGLCLITDNIWTEQRPEANPIPLCARASWRDANCLLSPMSPPRPCARAGRPWTRAELDSPL